MRRDAVFELSTVAAESPQMANTVRARHGRTGLQLCHRPCRPGRDGRRAGHGFSIVRVPCSWGTGALGNADCRAFFEPHALTAPCSFIRDSKACSTADEKSLVASVCGFGAVAIANAELYGTAREQAHELHQLLEISSQLGGIGELDRFLQTFVMRAADFLAVRPMLLSACSKKTYFAFDGEPKTAPRVAWI